jgi:hypothetical protein
MRLTWVALPIIQGFRNPSRVADHRELLVNTVQLIAGQVRSPSQNATYVSLGFHLCGSGAIRQVNVTGGLPGE